jgi:hypothetical protein
MGDAAGRKRISAVWKFQIFYGFDSDPFLAKSAKELGRFSRRFHLRPSSTSAVENPELPRYGKCLFKSRLLQNSVLQEPYSRFRIQNEQPLNQFQANALHNSDY